MRAEYSNVDVSVVAPGGDTSGYHAPDGQGIWTAISYRGESSYSDRVTFYLDSKTRVGLISGTSFSAPHVTGLVGLLLKLNNTLSAEEISEIVTRTAFDLGKEGLDEIYGYGRIDAKRAVYFTLFYKEPSIDVTPPIRFIGFSGPVGTEERTSINISNRGNGTLYAVFQISSTPPLSAVSAHLGEIGRQKMILVLAPQNATSIPIIFRIDGGGFTTNPTFLLEYCINEGIEPENLSVFGGDIIFPDELSTVDDFKSKGIGRCFFHLIDVSVTVEIRIPVCGDNLCADLAGENCENCPQDCGECPLPPGGASIPPGGASSCRSFCKEPLCIPIICLPKAGCTFICSPPPGLAICPLCCLWCAIVVGDPVELTPEQYEILNSQECISCIEDIKMFGGQVLSSLECSMCLEKVVAGGVSISSDCDMCFMSIMSYGEIGADNQYCSICLEQWEKAYQKWE